MLVPDHLQGLIDLILNSNPFEEFAFTFNDAERYERALWKAKRKRNGTFFSILRLVRDVTRKYF